MVPSKVLDRTRRRIHRGGLRSGCADTNFAKTLEHAQKGAKIRFSKHAELRFDAWNQGAKTEYADKLDDAINIAQSKGARSTLVLMKDVAFLVAPQTRTVVTVIPEDRMKQNVFTSIDSAVVVDR